MKKPRLSLILSMLIFGSIGLFVRMAPLPSALIALCRGVIGALVILLVGLVARRKFDWQAIRRNLKLLVASGIALGVNWILLFEAYRYTTISTATICYYLAPVMVTLASSLLFREKLTGTRLLCVLLSLAGLVMVAGAPATDTVNNFVGILYGVAAAVVYAVIVLLNKSLRGIEGSERTFVQLGVSALSLLPYVWMTGGFLGITLSPATLWVLLLLGVVHTGIAYLLYFSAVGALQGPTVAVLSYIDPVFAILLSALILSEPLGIVQIIGGLLVLGATLASEVWGRRQNGKTT